VVARASKTSVDNSLTFNLEKLSTSGTEILSKSWALTDFMAAAATGDSKGNTFVAGNNQMLVFDPNGNQLGYFQIPNSGVPCGVTQQGDTALVCYENQVYGFAAQ
jgi:hypothetical protein